MKRNQLVNILNDLKKLRVGILGDFCLDVYWEVSQDSRQISVETLKVIQQVFSQKCSLGGASNLALNVKALGAREVQLFGILGNDLYGRELRHLMQTNGLDTKGIFTQELDWLTNVYIKPMANGEEQNRFDLGFKNLPQEKIQELVLEQLEKSIPFLDIVIINQQLIFGIHTVNFRNNLNKIIHNAGIPFIVDSRNFPNGYNYAIRKMNEFELMSLFNTNVKPHDANSDADIKSAGLKLYEMCRQLIIVTRGPKSTFIFNENKVIEVSNIKVSEPMDTVGAGDSFLAGFASVYGVLKDPLLAVELGQKNAAITIKKIGETGVGTPIEILQNHQEQI